MVQGEMEGPERGAGLGSSAPSRLGQSDRRLLQPYTAPARAPVLKQPTDRLLPPAPSPVADEVNHFCVAVGHQRQLRLILGRLFR